MTWRVFVRNLLILSILGLVALAILKRNTIRSWLSSKAPTVSAATKSCVEVQIPGSSGVVTVLQGNAREFATSIVELNGRVDMMNTGLVNIGKKIDGLVAAVGRIEGKIDTCIAGRTGSRSGRLRSPCSRIANDMFDDRPMVFDCDFASVESYSGGKRVRIERCVRVNR